jgi:hypothetical protein
MVNVSTDVTTGNFGVSSERDHDMSKILTHTLSRPEGMLDRQTHRGAFLGVAKTAMHSCGKILQTCQRAPSERACSVLCGPINIP